jgi:hypothetical protein
VRRAALCLHVRGCRVRSGKEIQRVVCKSMDYRSHNVAIFDDGTAEYYQVKRNDIDSFALKNSGSQKIEKYSGSQFFKISASGNPTILYFDGAQLAEIDGSLMSFFGKEKMLESVKDFGVESDYCAPPYNKINGNDVAAIKDFAGWN